MLFKLIFSTYDKKTMKAYGFSGHTLTKDWEIIDQLRKRKRNIRKAKMFFKIDVIKKVWFFNQGFYYSRQMKEFVDTYVRDND